ncbi:MAG: gliding motility lipoprotein GldH [Bacteroidales bacterium]
MLIALAITLLLHACSPSDFYHDTRKIPDAVWAQGYKATFAVNFPDSLKPVDVYVDVRNVHNYPYSNLYLFLDTEFPDGRRFRDTLECMLATPEGKWLGRANGSVRESRFLIKHNVIFPRKGTYRFSFEQGMRESRLMGISEIGLKISPAGSIHPNR